jgi:hypothetical protein
MSEIDPELGARWRAASREQPPSALDDAIRAAARREVSARPGRMRALPRWLPLAAAATVAAVAVGIVQMAPPEQVTPSAFPAAMEASRQSVTIDAPKPAENAVKRGPPSDATPVSQREAPSSVAARDQRSVAGAEKAPAKVDSDNRFAGAPEALRQEKKARLQAPSQRSDQTAASELASKQKTEMAAPAAVARASSDVAQPLAMSPPQKESQPFPASPTPAGGGASNAPPPMAAAAPPTSPAATSAATSAAAPAPPPVAARKLAAQSTAANGSPSDVAGGLASRGAAAANAEPSTARDSTALGKVAATETDKAASERRKDAPPLAPDEWIKRIRRLIADGKNDDAAKELAAFRREYRERSDSLLPLDLRTFKP